MRCQQRIVPNAFVILTLKLKLGTGQIQTPILLSPTMKQNFCECPTLKARILNPHKWF